ncbi:hypothetical protein [Blastochloris viridis]|uniref:Uncharacterized protein n=1 Tax=Blastochloris viridis TaxID=1079 RepID=A0A0P0JN42_BLAVI|nr:hypothetical protein [Blastochloris viridis]ALK10756.1 hypothetical protein BVIR_2994 [Blastochloris viridis]CUU43418.1 hypothetical protein BVIRIDIS_24380 [Blastochloris viridis]
MPDNTKIWFAVYNPPDANLPFLAVMVGLDGNIVAVPYDTAAEAEAHNLHHGAELQRRLNEGG